MTVITETKAAEAIQVLQGLLDEDALVTDKTEVLVKWAVQCWEQMSKVCEPNHVALAVVQAAICDPSLSPGQVRDRVRGAVRGTVYVLRVAIANAAKESRKHASG